MYILKILGGRSNILAEERLFCDAFQIYLGF
jgi:hypothetical protein